MADLAKFDNAAAEAYLSLAEELGVDLTQSAVAESTSSLYTPYAAPEGVRATIDTHKTDIIKWNLPGESKEFPEQLFYRTPGGELVEFGPLNVVEGIIVDYSQRDQLDYYDGQKTNLLCSVIGFNYPDNPVKDLPKVAYGNKYTWVKNADGRSILDRTQPARVVENLGLVGQRGGKPTPCAECIRCGLSTEEYRDDKGEVRTAECQPRGKLHIVIFSVGKITKKRGVRGQEPTEQVEMRNVSDLCDEDGNPIGTSILLQVNMSRSFIQGRWNEDAAVSIVGIEGYFRNLERTYRGNNPQKNPLFNLTSVRLKQNQKAPIFQPHFEEKGMPTPEQIREAKSLWDKSVPARSAVSLAVEDFDRESIKSAVVVDVPPLRAGSDSKLPSYDADEEVLEQSPF